MIKLVYKFHIFPSFHNFIYILQYISLKASITSLFIHFVSLLFPLSAVKNITRNAKQAFPKYSA